MLTVVVGSLNWLVRVCPSVLFILLGSHSRSALWFYICSQVRVSTPVLMVLGHISILLWPTQVDQCCSKFNHILVWSSFAFCHQYHARKFHRISGYHDCDFPLGVSWLICSKVQLTSVTEMFSQSAFCRSWCSPGTFASTQIAHHDRYGQCVNSCSSPSLVVGDVLEQICQIGDCFLRIHLASTCAFFSSAFAAWPKAHSNQTFLI